jgi:phosphomannomutase
VPALRDRFAGPLHFGTAGLRGPLRGGPNGMNRAVVRRTAAGLAAHLGPGTTVVVGRDARHGSREFLADVGAVLAGAGVRALLLPRDLPTPVTAFAVLHLGADAGVMVTASHNPPQDNGLKVFLADGAQLASPVDGQVERAVAAVGAVRDLPLGEAEVLDDEVWQAYLSAVAALPRSAARDVSVAYTPLHGVGLETLLAAFERAGFAAPAVVAEQAEPDPDFPTVAFPNPEEPGALDLLLALSADADVAIASDPDADRIAVAVGDRPLRGDQTGVLLAEHLLSQGVRGRFATTVVSSSMLARSARRTTCRSPRRSPASSTSPAPGTTSSTPTRRRSASPSRRRSCATRTACRPRCSSPSWPRSRRRRGRTLLDRLADLEERFGRHETRQLSYRVPTCRASRPPSTTCGRAARGVRAVRRDRGRAARRRRPRAPLRWAKGCRAASSCGRAAPSPSSRPTSSWSTRGRRDGRPRRGGGRPAGPLACSGDLDPRDARPHRRPHAAQAGGHVGPGRGARRRGRRARARSRSACRRAGCR